MRARGSDNEQFLSWHVDLRRVLAAVIVALPCAAAAFYIDSTQRQIDDIKSMVVRDMESIRTDIRELRNHEAQRLRQ